MTTFRILERELVPALLPQDAEEEARFIPVSQAYNNYIAARAEGSRVRQ